jgi:tetratricopeptide (TPR) repeat protein
MGLFDSLFVGRRMRKAARRLYEASPDAEALVAALPAQAQAQARLLVARALADDDRSNDALAFVEQVLTLEADHREALELKAEVLLSTDAAAAVGPLERLRMLAPKEEGVLLRLADALIAADRAQEALSLIEENDTRDGPLVALRVGKALYALERSDEALEVLDLAMEQTDALGRADPFGVDPTAGDPLFHELRLLHQAVLAESHGSEAVVVDAALRRNLDSRAGVNFKLLANSMISQRPFAPERLQLIPAEEALDEGAARLKVAGQDVAGHLLVGAAHLRRAEFDRAIDCFDRAQRVTPVHFAAVLGEGAALELREQRAGTRVARKLPLPAELTRWRTIVPDVDALTTLELRVVAASVEPFERLLPRLEERGARIRVLPLDVLPTDLPELAALKDERHAVDHRAYAHIGGLASGTLAIVKVEELLDIDSEAGWTFAHELAHLVLNHATQPLAEAVGALYERFLDSEFVGGEYQISSVDEFFACTYVDWLRQRHGTTTYQERDDQGLLDDAFALFDGLRS